MDEAPLLILDASSFGPANSRGRRSESAHRFRVSAASSAGVGGGGFTALSSSAARIGLGTGKSPEPADRDVCPTGLNRQVKIAALAPVRPADWGWDRRLWINRSASAWQRNGTNLALISPTNCMKRRILFVDDEAQALQALEQALAGKREDWELLFASSGAQALELLGLEPCHVILADMHMPGMNGADLLKEVCQPYPKTIRFIVSTAADREFISQFSGDMHQFLAKPCDAETLISTLERTLAVDQWLTNDTIKGLVSRMRAFRSLPTLYVEVLKELRSPNASAQAVGEIVAKDLAMSAKMLQIVNSAFYGLQRKITDPSEAVLLLGMDTVQSLVLSIQVYAELDKVKPLYFSMDKLWRHSMAVGHLAKHLTRMVTDDPAMADEAFTAGLFHDIGKLVLATNLAEPYSCALALAIKRKLPLWEVEAELFGATHAETGAYLLGLWGLPVSVLEASALHHCPSRSVHASFSPLTAVHVVNALEYETRPDKEGFVAPEIDLAYLVKIGWRDELDHWRSVLSGRPMPLAAEAPQPATNLDESEAPALAVVPAGPGPG